MANEYICQNDIVEGQKCHIEARKVDFKRGGLRRDPIAGALVVVYSLDRNCSVEVKESLVMNDEERQHRDDLNVHYCAGDTIRADAIRLYIASSRNCLKFEVIEGISGRHGANVADTNIRTVGKIQIPLKTYAKLLGYSKNSSQNLIKQVENE